MTITIYIIFICNNSFFNILLNRQIQLVCNIIHYWLDFDFSGTILLDKLNDLQYMNTNLMRSIEENDIHQA